MVALGNVYEKLGEKSKALHYVEEGLRYKPDSSFLKRRYQELGGQSPYPDPYHSLPFEKDDMDQGNEAGIHEIVPSIPLEKIAKPAMENNSVKAGAKDKGAVENPYCRFCP